MAIFKCKMCGGALEINESKSVIECEYCGTKQTLPKLDDEKRANLYDRANHFRRNNEFDKAMGIYEQILNEDNTDAEAYWSLVLCRYGIEYVEDPSSHKRIPTVNRAQFTSIYDDDNYKSAIEYADSFQKSVYEEEAKAINEIQKGILAISQKEEPFDVFICYKETDNSGRRTPDSVLANDLYHQLTQEGFKVFFARITLEDKLGSAYEPYIFAALNSAKVMVVLGTKPEFFNAVWVKNEWSRYLALIKNGAKKMLIPAYKDMDPYDLPEEFSHLQAQDMAKLGFMQDLIRGIKKIAKADEPKATVVKETVISGGNANTAPLLKRAFMFLEDGDWRSANEYCEKVLDIDPECADAYLGKLMAEESAFKKEELKNCDEPFDASLNYEKVMRFGDEKLKAELSGYIDFINDRNEKARIEAERKAEEERLEAERKAEEARKEAIYIEAKAKMKMDGIYYYEEAITLLQSIKAYKDSAQKMEECKRRITEIKAEKERERLEAERRAEEARIAAEKRKRQAIKVVKIATPIVCAVVALVILLNTVILPAVERSNQYKEAVAMMEAGEYGNAVSIFEGLGEYKDSKEKIEEIKKQSLADSKVGNSVWFGSYEQDNNTENGKEAIQWLVLEVKDGKALVISKYALDCIEYNSTYTSVTWETCTLRKWLNDEFIKSAFSSDEKAMIPTVTVSADKNPEYDTNPGNATEDQVFLLRITEANKYFSSDSARQCEPTDFAVANGAWESDSGNCWWWLRSPGDTQNYAAFVGSGGGVGEIGNSVNSVDIAVRPALWIDLK